MLLAEDIKELVILQEKKILDQEIGVKRDLLDVIDINVPHAIIISGIRRCGKSTLLRQIMQKNGICNYFNLEDPRAANFKLNDFNRLERVFGELHPGLDCYYFDEIQNIDGWERFVRNGLDNGKKFVITGSNASLLSRELGTKLTGRHLTYELFPLSYAETLRLKGLSPSISTFQEYFENGGFPQYLKYGRQDMLQQLLSDIIMRDVVVRYGLKDAKMVERLALYLLSNVGKEFSYRALAKMFDLSSTHRIAAYISHFEDSYLLFTVPMFSFSQKRQHVNPKKIYAVDTGLINANTLASMSENGRMLENVVFMQLRRAHKPNSIFYHKGKRECDFVVKDKGRVSQAIQVCYKLTQDNLERELKGVREAMEAYDLSRGTIITMDQEDSFENVDIVPAWKWLK
ncbi:AAA family ATPase [Methanocella sp. CWC-04]|uniref:AAA family ATPase n=1 Tax=Methanooceanicella nereidis TaxID=2052831 RepID=A0AAP2W7L1_9EURY|nr:ATP-binding protein [Methanocella sp. CWC-04]MCD1295304.1 AAA family ATPase [Methanocella sp. CWC-04]